MKIIIKAVVMLVVIVWAGWILFKWGVMRQYVGPDQALVVMDKFGKELPPGRITIPAGESGYKGVQEEVLGPGRYFINPVFHIVEITELVRIAPGEPEKWDWNSDGTLKNPQTAPMVGIVALLEGKDAPAGQVVVDAGFKGVQKEVLTPGVYKLNPKRYQVTQMPATIVPPGSVGVVTLLVDDVPQVVSQALLSTIESGPGSGKKAAAPKRGILDQVLQPGIYYVNPRMVQINVVAVGYDAITLESNPVRAPVSVQPVRQGGVKGQKTGQAQAVATPSRGSITFFSKDGYQVVADFTVVWGRKPSDTPNIIRNIGGIDRVEGNVIEPAMKAACQNVGAQYTAMELIQGKTRQKFQNELSESLETQVQNRHLHILLALIRNISVKDNSGRDQTEGLIATIQRANIEVERELTNVQKTETASFKAKLETTNKLVDVAKETVTADSSLKVADIMAEGTKKAAELDAARDLKVASIQLEVALLEAKRREIMGKAQADVERLKNDAEAKGAKMLVDAFGSPAAYNKYIFAKNFEPKELRLIFAGPGTFWTDLKSFQEIGAAKMVSPATSK